MKVWKNADIRIAERAFFSNRDETKQHRPVAVQEATVFLGREPGIDMLRTILYFAIQWKKLETACSSAAGQAGQSPSDY